jgi:hypothetical protein
LEVGDDRAGLLVELLASVAASDVVETMKPAGAQRAIDRRVAAPQREQLPAADDAVLSRREPAN